MASAGDRKRTRSGKEYDAVYLGPQTSKRRLPTHLTKREKPKTAEALEALFRTVDVAKRAVNATYAYVHPDLWDKHTQYHTRDISTDGRQGYQNPEGRRAKAARARLDEVETDYSFAWDEASQLVNNMMEVRNALAHPLNHAQDFDQRQQTDFRQALQILQNENFLHQGECRALQSFVDRAHYLTRKDRGGPFEASCKRNQHSVDPFAGTNRTQQPRKREQM